MVIQPSPGGLFDVWKPQVRMDQYRLFISHVSCQGKNLDLHSKWALSNVILEFILNKIQVNVNFMG